MPVEEDLIVEPASFYGRAAQLQRDSALFQANQRHGICSNGNAAVPRRGPKGAKGAAAFCHEVTRRVVKRQLPQKANKQRLGCACTLDISIACQFGAAQHERKSMTWSCALCIRTSAALTTERERAVHIGRRRIQLRSRKSRRAKLHSKESLTRRIHQRSVMRRNTAKCEIRFEQPTEYSDEDTARRVLPALVDRLGESFTVHQRITTAFTGGKRSEKKRLFEGIALDGEWRGSGAIVCSAGIGARWFVAAREKCSSVVAPKRRKFWARGHFPRERRARHHDPCDGFRILAWIDLHFIDTAESAEDFR